MILFTNIGDLSDRKANTAPRFQQYMNNLDHFFLNALQNVTRLAIIGHEEGAIGQTDYHEALMPLRAECVPKLKELELGYYFIQDDFLDFLVAHSSTLEVWKTCVISTYFYSFFLTPSPSVQLLFAVIGTPTDSTIALDIQPLLSHSAIRRVRHS